MIKLYKGRVFLGIFIPFILVYLVFSFIQLNISFTNWDGFIRFGFIVIIIIVYITMLSFIDIELGGIKNLFTYNKIEELENKNRDIKEINKLMEEEVELLKKSGELRGEAKDFFQKYFK